MIDVRAISYQIFFRAWQSERNGSFTNICFFVLDVPRFCPRRCVLNQGSKLSRVAIDYHVHFHALFSTLCFVCRWLWHEDCVANCVSWCEWCFRGWGKGKRHCIWQKLSKLRRRSWNTRWWRALETHCVESALERRTTQPIWACCSKDAAPFGGFSNHAALQEVQRASSNVAK